MIAEEAEDTKEDPTISVLPAETVVHTIVVMAAVSVDDSTVDVVVQAKTAVELQAKADAPSEINRALRGGRLMGPETVVAASDGETTRNAVRQYVLFIRPCEVATDAQGSYPSNALILVLFLFYLMR